MEELKRFLAICIAVIVTANVFAYNFRVDGIYYNINSDETTVSVTYLSTVSYNNENAYQGDVVIPSTVTYNDVTYTVTAIDGYAFRNCYGMTSIIIPSSVTTIGEGAFYYCTGLTEITLTESITSIDSWTFAGCSNLTTVNIPNTVTAIGNYTFSYCSALSSLTIPKNVTTIGAYAFGNTGLTELICLAQTPPTIDPLTFYYVSRIDLTVYVPCGKADIYSNDEYWGVFENIQENCSSLETASQEGIINIYPNPARENIILEANEDVFIYNSLGQIVKQINNPKGETVINVNKLHNGIYYVRIGDKKQKFIKE